MILTIKLSFPIMTDLVNFSWVGKGHWSGSSWKGSEKETPVHMYTLNGERKEWDVVSSTYQDTSSPRRLT